MPALALLPLAFLAATAAAATPAVATIDAAISALERERQFSGAIVVEAAGQPILTKGYGFADRENEIPFTIDTIAQVGSLTKQFTAMTALVLADEGRLHLFRPIKTYLPEVPEAAANITLNQLMTHTAGLPEYCGEDFTKLAVAELISRCLAGPLLFEPGTRSEYSNTGFSVVAATIERVTGQPLEKVMAEKVLVPNGLLHTGYHFSDETGLTFSYGYDQGKREDVIHRRIAAMGEDWWALKGNGGMQAPARDMMRWAHVMRGEGALRAQTVRAATTPRHAADERSHEAYGWYVFFDNDGETLQVSHSGSDGVFFSYFWENPRDGYFFYLVGNGGEEVSRDAVREVRRILYDAGGGPPGQ